MSLIQPGTLLLCTKEVKLYNVPECLWWACSVYPSDYVLFLEYELHKQSKEGWPQDWISSSYMNREYVFTASAKVLVKEQVLYIRGVSGSWFFEALGEGDNHKSWSQEAMKTVFQQVSTNIKIYFEPVVSI